MAMVTAEFDWNAEVWRAFVAGAYPELLFQKEDRTMAAPRMSDQLLFVGGPKDGETLLIPPDRDWVDVPPDSAMLYGCGIHRDRRLRFWTGQEIFASCSLTDSEVIVHLLAGYGNPLGYRPPRREIERRIAFDKRGLPLDDWRATETEDRLRESLIESMTRRQDKKTPAAAAAPEMLAPIALQVVKPPVQHEAGACADCDGKAVIGSLHGTTPCACACHSS